MGGALTFRYCGVWLFGSKVEFRRAETLLADNSRVTPGFAPVLGNRVSRLGSKLLS